MALEELVQYLLGLGGDDLLPNYERHPLSLGTRAHLANFPEAVHVINALNLHRNFRPATTTMDTPLLNILLEAVERNGAIRSDRQIFAKLLIEKGIGFRDQDARGRTPLMLAVRFLISLSPYVHICTNTTLIYDHLPLILS